MYQNLQLAVVITLPFGFLQSAAFMEVIHSAIGSEQSVVSSDAMDRKGSVCGCHCSEY
ncbi:unnamed protein product [Trifolium pratense]|uniref:Uncharacterized protein n=1 Tax=Trifolium pratense TaxID=57577 RepID=A0ACB0MAC2_TRIPR|nr:unnamed protein product [Trifolium pratense]